MQTQCKISKKNRWEREFLKKGKEVYVKGNERTRKNLKIENKENFKILRERAQINFGKLKLLPFEIF
jgi:hypothetical protein